MACTPPTITVGGVILSTSDFKNAEEVLNKVSGAGGDPTLDEYTESVASGNNTAGKTGVLMPGKPGVEIPGQTAPPPPITKEAKEVNDKSPTGKNGTPIPGSVWNGDYKAPLSQNFKLEQFTIKTIFPFPLTDYNATYTKDTRFKNLQNLALNIAEPLLLKFGTLQINSGIRNISSGSNLSQHITGQAVDIQFPGWNYARYWENAQWVKDNIPYDQFIFEHSDKTGLAWFHLSYNPSGNRSPALHTKVMTMYRNGYSSGLRRYG